MMCLSELRRGQAATVANIPDEQLRVQLLRFGITAGCRVVCDTRLWAGPVVLRYGGQEIALGREVAKQIRVAR
ncbi:MAG: ferrous iron transport protein A [Desulfuromonadales bacterium]